MNRLLTPAGNVRFDGRQPRDGTEHRASPLNRLFSSPLFQRPLAPILLLAQSGEGSQTRSIALGGPISGVWGESPRAAPEVPRRCGRSTEEPDEPNSRDRLDRGLLLEVPG